MNSPQAFLNGEMISASQLSVPVYDAGFVQGTTVAEQLRTFGGKLFRLDEHLRRLAHSLATVGVEAGFSIDQLADAAKELASHNHALLPAGHDLQLAVFVTPGGYQAMAGGADTGPCVAMHTYPLPFGGWAAKFDEGERLSTVSIRQVPVCRIRPRSMRYWCACKRRIPRRRWTTLKRSTVSTIDNSSKKRGTR